MKRIGPGHLRRGKPAWYRMRSVSAHITEFPPETGMIERTIVTRMTERTVCSIEQDRAFTLPADANANRQAFSQTHRGHQGCRLLTRAVQSGTVRLPAALYAG